MRVKSSLLWVALAAALLPTLAARGDSVDVQLRGSDKLTGTIRPKDEVDCFLCDVAKGTVISASVKGSSKTGPAFQISLQQNGSAVSGATFAAKGLGGSLLPFTVPASGQYQLCVAGDGAKDGDYALAVSWKPQASSAGAGGPVAASGPASFTFSAAAGSTATIDVLPAKKSAFKGKLVDLEGPSGFTSDLSALTKPHAVTAALPTTGEYTVDFTNVGASGNWTAKVKVKAPKVKGGKYDLRDSASAGAFAGDHSAYGRIVGSGGGTLVVQTGVGSPIDGSQVTVQPGSLGGPTVITVSVGDPISTGDGSHGAGPAVDFGPSGTTFDPTGTDASKQAKITIPLDLSYFPTGDTSSLVIYVRAADGTVSQVPPPIIVDQGAGTVTFSASHFSTYQPATKNARPFEGDFVALEIESSLFQGFEGQFGIGLHDYDATDGVVNITQSDAVVQWHNLGQEGGSAQLSVSGSQIQYVPVVVDDQTVQFTNPGKGVVAAFLRGSSDDVLVAQGKPLVLLRRALGTATPTTIAGTWRVFHFSLSTGSSRATGAPQANLLFQDEYAGAVFNLDGTVDLTSLQGVSSATDYPTGQWVSKTEFQATMPGVTWSVDSDGQVQFVGSPGDNPTVLTPCVNGDVLVGRQFSDGGGNSGPSVECLLFIRASSGVSTASFAGKYRFGQFGMGTVDNPQAQEPPLAQDFEFLNSDFTATVAANGSVALQGTRDIVVHDASGNPDTSQTGVSFTGSSKISARGDGSFTSPDKRSNGAASRDRGLVVIEVADVNGNLEFEFGVNLGK